MKSCTIYRIWPVKGKCEGCERLQILHITVMMSEIMRHDKKNR